MLRLLVVLALTGCCATAAVDQAAIDDVLAGRRKEAKASWWGFDAADSTKALQAAISSGVPKLVVDKVGATWFTEPLQLVSNQEITFEPGVVVQAKRGSFQGTGDSLLTAVRCENVSLKGPGATLKMWRSDYAAAPYKKAEWRHVVFLRSCRNIWIEGLTLAESGGDGIYLGTTGDGTWNKDITIRQVICDRNYRQGISVICSENLLIEDTILRDTAGTAPQAGIDFEPNHANEPLINCVMRRCTTQGNRGGGYAAYLNNQTAATPPLGLRLEDCRSIDDATYGFFYSAGGTPASSVRGGFELIRCTFERPGGSAILITNKPAAAGAARLVGCRVVQPAAGHPELPPVLLSAGADSGEPHGNIDFGELTIEDDVDRQPIRFNDSSGDASLVDLRGTFIVVRGGQTQRFPLTKEQVTAWMPVFEIRQLPRLNLAQLRLEPTGPAPVPAAGALQYARQRRVGRWLLWAAAGETVRLALHYLQVGSYDGPATPLQVLGPDGKPVHQTSAAFKAVTETSFTAVASGLYQVQFDAAGNQAALASSTHRLFLNADGTAVWLIGSTGELWFWVPQGTRQFDLRVRGSGPREAVRALLYNSAGNLVKEYDDITTVAQFEVDLPAPSAGEAWRVVLQKPSHSSMEDFYLELRGIPSLFGATREALLRPAR
ncbi:MAG: right-handed parallel beta-helix repeat-containing protein [Fimbriimonadaceae bacterium]|nr:right-handed parallel beta-helix repeat-containing protein [Fimbriimonadaceae bacterium]